MSRRSNSPVTVPKLVAKLLTKESDERTLFSCCQTDSHISDEGGSAHLAVLQAAVLGMVGLLSGFSLSMAVTRFEARKGVVLDEANSIGTFWLRTQFLAADDRAAATALLRDYVDARIVFHDAGMDEARVAEALGRSEALQEKLWALAARAAAEDPKSVPRGLMIESLNDVIDAHEKRRVALENHVPDAVIVLLFGTSVVALGFVAFGSGLTGQRRLWTSGTLALLFGVVLIVILDIDRPRRGFIRVTQGSMLRLKTQLDHAVAR